MSAVNTEMEKLLMDAELVLVVVDGKLKVVKNRNMLTRGQLIDLLEELK